MQDSAPRLRTGGPERQVGEPVVAVPGQGGTRALLPQPLWESHRRTLAARCVGHCLANRDIRDGDTVFFDPDVAPTPGCVVAALVVNPDGKACHWLKVWQTDGREAWLETDGEGAHAPHRVACRRFVVWGVVWCIGRSVEGMDLLGDGPDGGSAPEGGLRLAAGTDAGEAPDPRPDWAQQHDDDWMQRYLPPRRWITAEILSRPDVRPWCLEAGGHLYRIVEDTEAARRQEVK